MTKSSKKNKRKNVKILSENTKKISKATKEQCISELKKIAEQSPEKIISRNYFRNNSPFSESAWSKHFGTFEEFKRQAGIIIPRHARKMELDVSRHASADNYRVMNDEKRDYAEKYLVPNDKKYQTILVGSDIHDIECDPFWRFMFLETIKRVQPEIIVLNGDVWDAAEFGKYNVDPREWDVVGRIKWVHKFLADIRKIAPNTQIDMIEGNHEYRLLRHLSEATPAMKAILSDLHGWSVAKLLGLDEYGINYIAPADLGTFTASDVKAEIKRNFKVYHNFLVAHHFPEGEKFGMPGWNGHHHSHQVSTNYSPLIGSFEWHQLGAGHKREASYCNGEKWGNGMLLVHANIKSKRAQFEYIDTSSNHVVLGGKWYERKD